MQEFDGSVLLVDVATEENATMTNQPAAAFLSAKKTVTHWRVRIERRKPPQRDLAPPAREGRG